MSKSTNAAQAKADEVKAKRKMLTPAERLAKAEADLKALREKAEAATKKQVDALLERRAALISQIEERQAKVYAIENELEALGFDVDSLVIDEAQAEADEATVTDISARTGS